MSRILVSVCMVLFSNLLFAQEIVTIDSVSTHVGQYIKICDNVSDAFQPKGENKLTYINFGGKYPDHKFTIIIYPSDLPNFPFVPADHYKNQQVCVTGIVTEYKGKPQIAAKFPEQIEIQ